MPFKAKMFRATTAIATCGLPGSSRVPYCGIVGHSSLEKFCIVWVVAQLSARISHSRSFEGAIPDIYKEDPGVRLRIMDGTSFWIWLAYMEDRVLDRWFSQPRYSRWKMCSLRWRELRAFLHSSI